MMVEVQDRATGRVRCHQGRVFPQPDARERPFTDNPRWAAKKNSRQRIFFEGALDSRRKSERELVRRTTTGG